MNFIFIMTDQLRPDHTGFGGNTIVQTPNLDKLAAESRRFNRAYCASPLCGPSRSSIFTSRMPSAHGNWLNTLGLDWEANTFVRVLKENGYRTALIGKSHLQDFASRKEVREGRPNLPLDLPNREAIMRFKRYLPEGDGKAVNRPWPENWNK
ncbi:MAG: sulfatase-like hydrolase/transferase, partial [Chloroflexota bacterium]